MKSQDPDARPRPTLPTQLPARGWFAPTLGLALTFGILMLGAGSCAGEAGLELVKVRDVTPHEVEAGERLVLLGEGFPPGKPAHVVFRGTLRRPGERPVRGAAITATGTAIGPDAIELAFDETTQSLFCGAGDRARHTTFEGDVLVAFAAAAPGAPPITGSLRDVVLDVHSTLGPADLDREREGERVLAFVGVRATQSPSGLVVGSVEPGSRAEAAQIESGDVLASFDGVRVATPADVVPSPGEREAAVGVRHAGSATESPRSLPVDGFRRAPPRELRGAFLFALVAWLFVALFALPTPPRIASRLQRIVQRLRGRMQVDGRDPAPRSGWRQLMRAFTGAARDGAPRVALWVVPDALIGCVLATLPFGQYLVASRLDAGLLFVAGATALAASALVSGETALRGAEAAAYVVWRHVPAAIAVASAVVSTGSMRVQEIERAQGGWPWEWLAFRHPATLVAFFVLAASTDIALDALEPPPAGRALAKHVELGGAVADGAKPRVGWETARRVHRLIFAGLASALFLGGWLLPGVPAPVQDARPWLETLGAALLLAKTAAVVFVVAGARAFGPKVSMRARARATFLRDLPLGTAALAVTAAWSRWGPGSEAQVLVSYGLFAAVALAAAALAQRLGAGVRSPEARLSPFL